MYHLGLFDSSIATATETQLAAVADDILVIQQSGFVPQDNMAIAIAFALGTNLQYAYLTTPTFRQVTTPFLRPTNQGATFPSFGGLCDYRQNPLKVKPQEVLAAYAYQDAVGAENEFVGVALQQSYTPAPQGDIYTMRATSTTAAVASAWTQLTMTWQNTLPSGRYAVVGWELQGAAGIASRLILPGQTLRPGSIVVSADSVQGPPAFRKGGMGLWGYFTSVNLPKVEVYATAATASWTAYLDLIRLTDQY